MSKSVLRGIVFALVLEGMLGLASITPTFSVFDDIVHRSRGTVGSAEPVSTAIGYSENGLLVEQWNYTLLWPVRYLPLMFGSSPAIADLGVDVNRVGEEPSSDLEVVTGSAEYDNFYPELNKWAHGIWRAFDSYGNLEWAKDTETDQSMSSPSIVDIDGDGDLEIAGGTTSGWNVEIMNHTGSFIWTFPYPPQPNGEDMWHSSPAIADLNASVSGLEVVIGNNPKWSVWAFDGDNTDGIDEGITADISGWGYPRPVGTEGEDWDVLWVFQTNGAVISSPSVGDVDSDNQLEVVIGSEDHYVYCLNGANGTLEWSYETGNSVYSSAGLADFDNDGDLEVVIGSTDGSVYFVNGDENENGSIDSDEVVSYSTSFLSPVCSSPAIGDVDGDGNLEVIIGCLDGNVYSFDYDPSTNTVTLNWATSAEDSIYSSPALVDRTSVQTYERDWPMFRHDARRTGFYGTAPPTGLDIIIGSDDHYLYLLRGDDGAVIDRFLTYGSIRTSPSVADVHGENELNIFFYDHGYDSFENDTFWAVAYLPVHNLNSDLRYSTIQKAIDDAETLDGHTVEVYAGIYNENVNVNKSLSIIGAGASTTIINATKIGPILHVNASNVKISGFTIQNGNRGINVLQVNNTIKDNIIRNITGTGVYVNGRNNTINGNNVTNNDFGIGIAGGARENTIVNNIVTRSRLIGIHIYGYSNIIGNNNITNNGDGLRISGAVWNTIYHNNFVGNTRHGIHSSIFNVWYDGYPFGGNYWDNYTGVDLHKGPFQNETDSDGIGDTPYLVYGSVQDKYPLMNPYTPPPPLPIYTLEMTRTEGGNTDPPIEEPAPIFWACYKFSAEAKVPVTAIPDPDHILDHWELDDNNVGSTNPYLLTMNAYHTLHAVFVIRPYDVVITAICLNGTEGKAVSVGIKMDGSPTGYSTPHTFKGLTGSHSFSVPSLDPNGHPFWKWNTDSYTPTIEVTSGGTYIAYYRTPSGVGGIVVPVDKFGLLAPYIGVASMIIVVTAVAVIYVNRVRHREEKQ